MRPSRGVFKQQEAGIVLGGARLPKEMAAAQHPEAASAVPARLRAAPGLRVSERGPATQKVLYGRVHGRATAWPPRGAPIGPTTRAEGGGREGVAAAVASFWGGGGGDQRGFCLTCASRPTNAG